MNLNVCTIRSNHIILCLVEAKVITLRFRENIDVFLSRIVVGHTSTFATNKDIVLNSIRLTCANKDVFCNCTICTIEQHTSISRNLRNLMENQSRAINSRIERLDA